MFPMQNELCNVSEISVWNGRGWEDKWLVRKWFRERRKRVSLGVLSSSQRVKFHVSEIRSIIGY